MASKSTTRPNILEYRIPEVPEDVSKSLVSKLYGLKVKTLKDLDGFADKSVLIEVEEEYDNPHIPTLWPHGYVLKYSNNKDSETDHPDAQCLVLEALHGKGIRSSKPVKNIHGQYVSLETIQQGDIDDKCRPTKSYKVRLLSYLPGELLATKPRAANILYQQGKLLGELDLALKGFQHPALAYTPMDLKNLRSIKEQLSSGIHNIKEDNTELMNEVIEAFDKEVCTNLHQFQKGVIHADGHGKNILLSQVDNQQEQPNDPSASSELHVSGIIDFGDAVESCYIFEMAICIAHAMMSGHYDMVESGGHILAGYTSIIPLNKMEFDALKVSIAGRIVKIILVVYYYSNLDENKAQGMWKNAVIRAEKWWPLLDQFWKMPNEDLCATWMKIIRTYSDRNIDTK